MALEAYSQFHGFDWLNNPDWLAFEANLEIPDDSPDVRLTKRQQWFKRHINPDFDPSFAPASSKSEPSTNSEEKLETAPKEGNKPQKPATGGPRSTFTVGRMFLLMMNVLGLVHGILALLNLFSYILLGPTHFVFAFLHSMLSYGFLLFQAVGKPSFSIKWVHTAVNNESMHYILYCMMFMAQAPRPITILPILIYALVNVSILLPRFLSSMGIPLGPVAILSSTIREHKSRLLQSASNIELAVFVSLLLDLVMGDISTLLPTVVYLNFLGSRMQVSAWTQTTVHRLESAVDSALLSQAVPSFVGALYLQVKSIIKRLAAPQLRPAPQ